MNNKQIYFPNLNGLRFIAALLVIILHIEQIKSNIGVTNLWHNKFIYGMGKLGVILFFVLSGFLISYLLFKEDKETNTINLRVFYFKRVKRIWPLYYLVVFLAFFILPYISLFESPRLISLSDKNMQIALFLYCIILPNIALIKYGAIPFVSQAWSIGAEEQFYIFWPIILSKFRKHKLACILFTIIIFSFLKFIVFYRYSHITVWGCSVYSIFSTFNIFCMAIGGLFAYLLFVKSFILKFILNKIAFSISLFMIFILLIISDLEDFYNYEKYSIFAGVIVLNLSQNTFKNILECKLFNFLGKISYGLYMYHVMAIFLSINILKRIDCLNSIMLYILSISFTIFIAYLSFNYFESFFMKKRLKS